MVKSIQETFAPNLACFGCGRIQELASPTFEKLKGEIISDKRFKIDVIRLEVGGVCGDCAARKKSAAH